MEKHVVLESLGQETENFLHTLKVGSRATVIGLYGELGSGKTTFVQHVAQALGIEQPVTSPTFVIERIYALRGTAQTPRGNTQKFDHLIHIDAYRLESSDELRKLGFDELLKDPENVIFVEWAERVEDILPTGTIKIEFEIAGEKRRKMTVSEK